MKNKSQINNSKTALKSTYSDDSIAKSVLSAKHLRLVNQENEIQCLKNQMDILVNENKTLRTQILRQEKELFNIDNQDFNVNKLIEQHKAEILVSKEKLRKVKTNLTMEQNLRKEYENEILKLRSALLKSKEIIAEKGLVEKMQMKKQLDDALKEVSTTKRLLEISQNKLEYLECNYKVELSNSHKQSRSHSEKCEELQSKINFLNISLKEKEKLLEIQNIYSNRFNLIKLNKKFEDSLACKDENYSFCESKSLIELSKSEKISGNFKSNSEQKFQILNKRKMEQSDFNRNRILEDIRKVISEEIDMGNFTIIYRPSQTCLDKQLFPLKPLTIDKHVDSPFITDDSTEIEKPLTKTSKDSEDNYFQIQKNSNHVNDNLLDQTNDTSTSNPGKSQSSIDEITINLPKSKSQTKIKPITDETSSTQFQVESKNESQLQFMYPKHDSIISTENWWEDLETISVLNSVSEVKNKSHNLVKIKDKDDSSKLPNSEVKSYTTFEFMHKLPKPIIEDLQDRDMLIDKTYRSLFSDTRIGRICIGNINQKNMNTKLSVNQVENNDHFYQPNTVSSVI